MVLGSEQRRTTPVNGKATIEGGVAGQKPEAAGNRVRKLLLKVCTKKKEKKKVCARRPELRKILLPYIVKGTSL